MTQSYGLIYSADAVNWRPALDSAYFGGGASGDGRAGAPYGHVQWDEHNQEFIACGQTAVAGVNYVKVSTSPDGKEWTVRNLQPGILGIAVLVMGPDKTLIYDGAGAFGAPTGYAYVSSDNRTWSAIATNAVNAAVWDGSTYVGAWGRDPSTFLTHLGTSPDGITWTSHFTTSAVVFSIAFNGSVAIACGLCEEVIWSNGPTFPHPVTLWTSADHGVTWTPQSSIYDHGNMGVACWTGTAFIGGGSAASGPAFMASSPDGYTWTASSTPGIWGSHGVFVPPLGLTVLEMNGPYSALTADDGTTFFNPALSSYWPQSPAGGGSEVAWSPELGILVAAGQFFGPDAPETAPPTSLTLTGIDISTIDVQWSNSPPQLVYGEPIDIVTHISRNFDVLSAHELFESPFTTEYVDTGVDLHNGYTYYAWNTCERVDILHNTGSTGYGSLNPFWRPLSIDATLNPTDWFLGLTLASNKDTSPGSQRAEATFSEPVTFTATLLAVNFTGEPNPPLVSFGTVLFYGTTWSGDGVFTAPLVTPINGVAHYTTKPGDLRIYEPPGPGFEQFGDRIHALFDNPTGDAGFESEWVIQTSPFRVNLVTSFSFVGNFEFLILHRGTITIGAQAKRSGSPVVAQRSLVSTATMGDSWSGVPSGGGSVTPADAHARSYRFTPR